MLNRLLPNPLPKWPFFLINVINILAIFIAIVAALLLGHYPKHFMDEGQPLTFLSTAELLFISLLCGMIFARRKAQYPAKSFWRSPAFIWVLLSVGFVFVACDELFSIHEGLDRTIHYQLDLDRTDLTDRLDDLILVAYLAVFFLAVYWGRKELKCYRQLLPLFQSGIALTGAMIFFDALSHTTDIITSPVLYEWLNALEDSLKLIAVGLLLSLAYYCLQVAKLPISNVRNREK